MRRNSFFPNVILLPVMAALIGVAFQQCSRDHEPAQRVILIGIDGVGVSGFQKARTPNLDALAQQGALSLKTRAVMPTVSAPNWGSHLLGAGPEQHGITYNGWTTSNHSIDPSVSDEAGYFPSVFTLIREQVPGALTGFFYDWDGLADLFNLSLIDTVEFSNGYAETLEKATPWIIANDPDFTFIYMGHPDEEGHAHQWGSNAYIEAIETVDAALGGFFGALKDAGKYDGTHFIVVSDHGGVSYGHGGLSMEEIEIPWIIAGPGIVSNVIIEQPNDVMNTAATIAYLFGLEQPDAWIGRPVYGAVENHPVSKHNTKGYVPQPTSSIEGGMYLASEAVSLSDSDPSVTIRYTLDGADPSTASPVYKSPILMQKSGTLKAIATRGEQASRVTTVQFIKVLPVTAIQLTHQADEKYGANGPGTLVNRETGSVQFNDGKWLGFHGTDLEAVLELPERMDISKVTIGFLNNPGSWIFPPQLLRVYASVNGDLFKEIGGLDEKMIKSRLQKGHNSIRITTAPASAKYLKVVAVNTGICPPGHAGEGEPAWLFVDEIILE